MRDQALGTEFAVSFTVDSGIPFKVIGRKGVAAD